MKTAIVVGGGIAGLASAKVLANHFDKVTVYDGGPQAQALHLHVLLKHGQDLLEKLFQGILSDMRAQDCPEIDWALDTFWENASGIFPRYPSSVKALSMSRSLLQDLMLTRVKALPNINLIHERVANFENLDADLVVRATGQHSTIESVHQEVLPINLTYRSFVFYQQDLNLDGFKQYYYQVDPPHSKIGGVISPIEHGKVMVTLIESENKVSNCSSLFDFLEKAARIPGGNFLSVIGKAQPVTKLAVFRKNTIHRRKLDISKLPKNTIVLGDVLTSLNPVFGQGMTVALKQTLHLKESFRKTLDVSKFQKELENISYLPYSLSKLGSHEEGAGKLLLNTYLKACQRNTFLHHNFLKRLHYP